MTQGALILNTKPCCEWQVEALQLAVGSSTRRVNVADAFAATSPRASHDSPSFAAESPMSLRSTGALSEEDFAEHPRAIALHSQLSVLRRTVTALHKYEGALPHSRMGQHTGLDAMTMHARPGHHMRRPAAQKGDHRCTDARVSC